MRRVAIVCPDLSVGGGVQSVTRFVLDCLTAAGDYQPYLVSLATSSEDRASSVFRWPSTWAGGAQVLQETSDGLDFLHVGSSGAELEWLRYMKRPSLDRVLAPADLVHVVAGTPAWGLAVQRSGKPNVLHVATLTEWERADSGGTRPLRVWRRAMTLGTKALDRRALRHADEVLAMNAQLAGFAQSCRGKAVSLLYPGTNVDWFSPGPPALHGHLLAVGRLADARKDWATLLRAYASSRASQQALPRLIIAGRGQLSAADEALRRALGLHSFTTIIADPSPAELLALYRGACLYLLSSAEEGFGIAVVEAMACGLPVVATRLAGTQETVLDERTGLLVDRDSDLVAKFAEAVTSLWADPQRRLDMGLEGRARAVELFSNERSGETLLSLYGDLLGPLS